MTFFEIYQSCLNAAFNMRHNVGSYTQGRIAGDFLSIPVNRDRAERCPPKTTAAGQVADVVCSNLFFLFTVSLFVFLPIFSISHVHFIVINYCQNFSDNSVFNEII